MIVLAGKAYDSDRIRELIHEQGATPNMPPKSNRKWKPCFSKRLYRERNLIERFFSKLKHFRRVATRYDKLADNFLAMVQLASMRLWLRVNESTAKSNLALHHIAMALSVLFKGGLTLGDCIGRLLAEPGYVASSNYRPIVRRVSIRVRSRIVDCRGTVELMRQ